MSEHSIWDSTRQPRPNSAPRDYSEEGEQRYRNSPLFKGGSLQPAFDAWQDEQDNKTMIYRDWLVSDDPDIEAFRKAWKAQHNG